MSNSTIEILEEARRLIALGWTQNEMARNAEGEAVLFTSDEASCFCIYGAICRATFQRDGGIDGACEVYNSTLGGAVSSPIFWNDRLGRTQEEVVKYLDKLIQEKKESHA